MTDSEEFGIDRFANVQEGIYRSRPAYKAARKWWNKSNEGVVYTRT